MRTKKVIGRPRGRGHLHFHTGTTVPVSYEITIWQDFIDGTPGLFDLDGSLVFVEEVPEAELFEAFGSNEIVPVLEDPTDDRRLEIVISGRLNLPAPRRCSFRVRNPHDLIADYEST